MWVWNQRQTGVSSWFSPRFQMPDLAHAWSNAISIMHYHDIIMQMYFSSSRRISKWKLVSYFSSSLTSFFHSLLICSINHTHVHKYLEPTHRMMFTACFCPVTWQMLSFSLNSAYFLILYTSRWPLMLVTNHCFALLAAKELPCSALAPSLEPCFSRPERPANRRPPSRWASHSPTASQSQSTGDLTSSKESRGKEPPAEAVSQRDQSAWAAAGTAPGLASAGGPMEKSRSGGQRMFSNAAAECPTRETEVFLEWNS